MTSPPAARGGLSQRLTSAVVFAVLGTVAFLMRASRQATSDARARLALLTAVLAVVSLFRLNRLRPFSLGPVYTALFLLFYVGLLVPIALGVSPSLLNDLDIRWVLSDRFTSTSLLVTIAAWALMFGYLIGFKPVHRQSVVDKPETWAYFRSAGHIGVVLLAAGCLLWVYNVLASGAAVSGSYVEFLDSTAADVVAVAGDPAVFEAITNGRVGTIGGSPAAEALCAGGVVGLVLVIALIGQMLERLDPLETPPLRNVIVGTLPFVPLRSVRGDFTLVPLRAAIAVGVAALARAAARHRRPPDGSLPAGPMIVRKPRPGGGTT